MVSTVISFRKADVQPPVFVAGSFTEWSPLEMIVNQTEAGALENEFSYEADLQPGDHQYKFRLGPGDWWVLDESSPSGMCFPPRPLDASTDRTDFGTADDGSGNINNILTVRPVETKASGPEIVKSATSLSGASPSAPNTKSSPLVPVVDEEKTPAGVSANIGQKIVKEQGSKKNTAEEKSTKVNSQFDGNKEDPLPDIAPPPYSVATKIVDGLTPSSMKSESATLEGTDGRNNARGGDIKSHTESKQSPESWTDRLCSRK